MPAQDPCIDSWEWHESSLAADRTALLERREQHAADLRAATYAGFPYGEPEFVEQLEKAVQRPLRRLKPERKPKARAAGVSMC